MTDYPYFKAFTTNILMDTMGMTLEQKGQYLDDLVKAWSTSNADIMPEWMFEQADKAMSLSKTRSKVAKDRWLKSTEKRRFDANAHQMQSNSNAIEMQTPYIERKKERDINAIAYQKHDSFSQPTDRPLTADQLAKMHKIILGELPGDTVI